MTFTADYVSSGIDRRVTFTADYVSQLPEEILQRASDLLMTAGRIIGLSSAR